MIRRVERVETPRGALEYEISEEGCCITITGYSGTDTEVIVPGDIEGLPVTAIAKKTFLSRKHLRRVVLPETIEEIGDWAFTYCTNLESVWIPKKKCRMGSRIFMECRGIRRLYAYEPEAGAAGPGEARLKAVMKRGTEEEEQTAALLAAGAILLDTEYLMNPLEAGTEPWIRQWDARMDQFMKARDSEGYTKMILCGEEDVGSSLEIYLNNRRKSKVRLALLRLMNPIGLSEESREELKDYLAAHTKGCESEETWEVILGEHSHEQEYFQTFAEIGGVTEENFDAILGDMKEEHAEMKAFFLRYREEKLECKDFFDTLSLESW